jgi:hypothetical protein
MHASMVDGNGNECIDGLHQWLTAPAMSAQMVDGNGNECVDG